MTEIKPIKLNKQLTTTQVLKRYKNLSTIQEFWEFADPRKKIPVKGHFFFTMERIGKTIWMAYLDVRDGGRGISCFPILPRDEWYDYYQVLTTI